MTGIHHEITKQALIRRMNTHNSRSHTPVAIACGRRWLVGQPTVAREFARLCYSPSYRSHDVQIQCRRSPATQRTRSRMWRLLVQPIQCERRRRASNGRALGAEKRQSARKHAQVGCRCSADREACRRRLGVDLARRSVQPRQLRRSTAPVETPTRQTTGRRCWPARESRAAPYVMPSSTMTWRWWHCSQAAWAAPSQNCVSDYPKYSTPKIDVRWFHPRGRIV